jgi:hypothetical protein
MKIVQNSSMGLHALVTALLNVESILEISQNICP